MPTQLASTSLFPSAYGFLVLEDVDECKNRPEYVLTSQERGEENLHLTLAITNLFICTRHWLLVPTTKLSPAICIRHKSCSVQGLKDPCPIQIDAKANNTDMRPPVQNQHREEPSLLLCFPSVCHWCRFNSVRPEIQSCRRWQLG